MLFEDAKRIVKEHTPEIDALIIKEDEIWLAPDNGKPKEFLEKIFQSKVELGYKGEYRIKNLPGVQVVFEDFMVTLKNI